MSGRLFKIAALVGRCALAGIAIGILAITFWQPLLWSEQRLKDIRVNYFSKELESRDQIIIVGITQSTLDRFPYRSPVDREFLANLLDQIESKGARAIGVDLEFDQPTEADKDQKLKLELQKIKIPLAINHPYFAAADSKRRSYIDEFVPSQARAFPAILQDSYDGTDRWFYPQIPSPNGIKIFGFAGLLANKLGAESSSAQLGIVWRAQDKSFVTISAEAMRWFPDKALRNKIVLVGLLSSDDETHRTPLSITANAGGVSDVTIQAQALATLLDNRTAQLNESWQIALVTFVAGGLGGAAASFIRSKLNGMTTIFAILVMFYLVGFIAWYEFEVMLPLAVPSASFLLASLILRGKRSLSFEKL